MKPLDEYDDTPPPPPWWQGPVVTLVFVFILILFCEKCHAREVRVSWDNPPAEEQVVGWRVWKGTTLIHASNTPTAILTLTNEETTITLTSINAVGESPHSAPLTIPLPDAIIQRSKDLTLWTTLMTIPARNHLLLRVRITSPTVVTLEQTYDAAPDWQIVTNLPYDPPEFFRIQLPPP